MVMKGRGHFTQRVKEGTIELDLYEMKKMGVDLGRENSKCNDSEVGLSFARNDKKTSVGEEEEGWRRSVWLWKGCAALVVR